MKLKAWVDVYAWNNETNNLPFIWSVPPTSDITPDGKRYLLTFQVPDPVKHDGEIAVSHVEDTVKQEIKK